MGCCPRCWFICIEKSPTQRAENGEIYVRQLLNFVFRPYSYSSSAAYWQTPCNSSSYFWPAPSFLINFCQLAVSLSQKSSHIRGIEPKPIWGAICMGLGSAEIMRIDFPVRDTGRRTDAARFLGG